MLKNSRSRRPVNTICHSCLGSTKVRTKAICTVHYTYLVSEDILCPLLVQLLSRHTQLARPQHVCWNTSKCSVESCVVEAMKEMSIETLFFAVGLSITCCLLASSVGGFASWVRTAWMLRKLPKSNSNRVYGGLLDMLSSNRLRVAQRMNEEIVSGSGVFYFNALWRQVGVP